LNTGITRSRNKLLKIIFSTVFGLGFILVSGQTEFIPEKNPDFVCEIKSNQTIGQLIETLKTNYNILMAYESNLNNKKLVFDIDLKAENPENLVKKICVVLQLNFVKVNDVEFLIREETKTSGKTVLVQVISVDNKMPIENVLVYIDSSALYTFSDQYGDALLHIDEKHQNIHIKTLDFLPQTIDLSSSQVVYRVNLQPPMVEVPCLEFQVQRPKISFLADVEKTNLSLKALEGISFSSIFGKDILRTAQMLSGVNAIHDASANLQIRGSAHEATLIMLDGMPIYKADHFYGILSSINGYYVSDLELYKNNIPVEFGGKTSGMLKLLSPKSNEKFSAIVEINALYAASVLKIPLSNNSGMSLGGRITYTNIARSKFDDLVSRNDLSSNVTTPIAPNFVNSRPNFDFYDFNFRYYHHIGKHKFTLNGFLSRDSFVDSRQAAFKTRLYDVNEELFRNGNGWNNQATSFTHQYSNGNHSFDTRLFSTTYTNRYNIYALFRQMRANTVYTDTVNILNENTIRDLGINVKYLNKKHHFLLGFEALNHNNYIYLENASRALLELDDDGNQWNLFTEKSFFLNNQKIEIKPAVRVSYMFDFQRYYVLPQILITYTPVENLVFKSTAGRQMQYIRLLEHENNLGQKQQFFALSNDSSIPIGLSNNFMVGFNKSYPNFQLDVESYYRILDGAITHASLMPGLRNALTPPSLSDYRVFVGEARSFGADISLIYDRKHFFSMISYTLSKSENRYEAIFNNQYFPSSEDSRHQFKWVNNYNLKHFDFTINYIGASGRPYLDLSTLTNFKDRNNINITEVTKYLDPYSRVDVGISYRMKLGKLNSKIGFSVFNLTNHVNVRYKQFIFRIPTTNNTQNSILGSDVVQLDRTYNLSFVLLIE